jgi:hypothetical protein
MQHSTRLVLISVAGAATIAVAVLFMSEIIPTSRMLYPVLAITILAAGAGIGSVYLARPPTTLRAAPLAVAAFAAGMTVATIAFAVHTHFASLEIEDPRHRVAWPLFAVLFVGTILLAVAAFSAATVVTAAMVQRLRANKRHLTDA